MVAHDRDKVSTKSSSSHSRVKHYDFVMTFLTSFIYVTLDLSNNFNS